jgi:hypothetical protein
MITIRKRLESFKLNPRSDIQSIAYNALEHNHQGVALMIDLQMLWDLTGCTLCYATGNDQDKCKTLDSFMIQEIGRAHV